MRTHVLVIPTLVVALTATALPGGDKKGADELQGIWQIVSLTTGNKGEDEKAKKIRMVFKGDKLFMHLPEDKVREQTYKADPTKTPKHLDITQIRGDKTRTVMAVYKIEGDTLTICLNDRPEGPRPTEFKVSPDNDRISLGVLKRVKE